MVGRPELLRVVAARRCPLATLTGGHGVGEDSGRREEGAGSRGARWPERGGGGYGSGAREVAAASARALDGRSVEAAAERVAARAEAWA